MIRFTENIFLDPRNEIISSVNQLKKFCLWWDTLVSKVRHFRLDPLDVLRLRHIGWLEHPMFPFFSRILFVLTVECYLHQFKKLSKLKNLPIHKKFGIVDCISSLLEHVSCYIELKVVTPLRWTFYFGNQLRLSVVCGIATWRHF